MENTVIALFKKSNSAPIFYKIFRTTDNKLLIMNLNDNYDIVDNFKNKIEIFSFFEELVNKNNFDSFQTFKSNSSKNYITKEEIDFNYSEYLTMLNSFKEDFESNDKYKEVSNTI